MKKSILIVVCVMFLSNITFAQADSTAVDDFLDMDLEALMDMEISVASKTAMSIRETPGVVTVITKTEIENSGARDLMDILRLVPGIEFGVDVQGQVGISMRGNWAHEGKVLLMIDGQEMNELDYSTTLYGGHYSVDNIKRVEIIRGPGSSVYGGYAELGVISIITESGEDINGVKAVANYAHTGKTGTPSVAVSIGKKINDFEFSLSGSYKDGNRSDNDHTDMYGGSYSMTDNSDIKSANLNAGIKYKGLSARFIYDDYKTDSRDLYDENTDYAYAVNFGSLLGEIKYDWKINEKLTITPKFNYIQNKPWASLDEPISSLDSSIYWKYDRTVTKLRPSLVGSYDLNDNINFLAGVDYSQETGVINSGEDATFYDGSTKIMFTNIAAFAQAIIKSNIVNTAIGVRYEKHSMSGDAFAPRIGFTRVFGDFHAKLLYSMAFRSPSISNINNNAYLTPDLEPNITPEQTQVSELEVGYNITKSMSVTANVFHIQIDDAIVFYYDEAIDEEGYFNAGRTGTNGFDLEYKIKQKWGYANLAYSFYFRKGNDGIADYAVVLNEGTQEDALLGAPQHKVMLNSSFNITEGLSINPSLTFLGKRYAYTSYDPIEDDVVLDELAPLTLLNVFINYRNLLTEGLNVGLGAYNILNVDYKYAQPYNGWHTPYPGKGLELAVKISYLLQ